MREREREREEPKIPSAYSKKFTYDDTKIEAWLKKSNSRSLFKNKISPEWNGWKRVVVAVVAKIAVEQVEEYWATQNNEKSRSQFCKIKHYNWFKLVT